jgi:hypothetical protein
VTPRRSDSPVGTVQIAARFKVKPATVRKWRERFGEDSTMHDGAPRFPDPIAYDGNRPLYRMDDIVQWRDAVDPWLRPGRPVAVEVV